MLFFFLSFLLLFLLLATWKGLSIELLDDRLADLVVDDAGEPDALRVAGSLAHYARRGHIGAELALEHVAQRLLVHVQRQVGEVQIGGILFALLGQLDVLLLALHLAESVQCVVGVLEVDEAVALALARRLVDDGLGRLDVAVLVAHVVQVLVAGVLAEAAYVQVGSAREHERGLLLFRIAVTVAVVQYELVKVSIVTQRRTQ